MENSKTIKTINDFYTVIQKGMKNVLTDDEEFFICNIELELAKSIIQEFDITVSKRLANVILSVTQ